MYSIYTLIEVITRQKYIDGIFSMYCIVVLFLLSWPAGSRGALVRVRGCAPRPGKRRVSLVHGERQFNLLSVLTATDTADAEADGEALSDEYDWNDDSAFGASDGNDYDDS